MKQRLFSLVLLALSLGACSVLPLLNEDLEAQVNRYVEQEDYGKALDVLSFVHSDHRDYTRMVGLRSQVEARAKTFEQNQLRRAGELTARGKWGEAHETYRQALIKLPRSQPLREGLQEFHRKQALRVDDLKTERLIARARWCERALLLQEALVAADPEAFSERLQLDRLREEAAALSSQLTRLGTAALDAGNLGVAARMLPVAARLNPSPATESAKDLLGEIEARQAEQQRVLQEQAIARLRQRESTQLMTEYHQALDGGDLRRARQLMGRLLELDGNDPALQKEQDALNARVEQTLQGLLDAGVRLYSRGHFEDAVVQWNNVLAIDPDNEQARVSVERAERVLSKLRQLREKQNPQK